MNTPITIAINALNSNSGGGRGVRDAFIDYLKCEAPIERVIVIAAETAELDLGDAPNMSVHRLPADYARGVASPWVYRHVMNRILKVLAADVVLNLGDLVIETSVPQVYLFDWPYALDVHPRVWASMTWPDWLQRRCKLRLVRRDIGKAHTVVAQTKPIAEQLRSRYGLERVHVVGNAVAATAQRSEVPFEAPLPEGVRLLVPSLYYPHKNLEILLDVAARVKAAAKPYRFVVTVAPAVSPAAQAFIDAIAARGLSDVVRNVGQQPNTLMPGLFRRCHGMLLPTLLESFSITYVEAMQYGLPILTSDMWFAHGVCERSATYFDPFDADDILRAIDRVYASDATRAAAVRAGDERLATMPDWRANGRALMTIVREVAAAQVTGS